MLNLSDFTSLIQLLVGSVFISNITFRKIDPFENERGKLIDLFCGKFQGLAKEYGYKTIDKSTWRIDNKELMSSVMLILTVYGCIVLFYCAAFNNNQDSPTLGLLFVSVVSFLYQVYAMYIYGRKRTISHKIVSWVVLGIILLLFIVQIAIPIAITQMSCHFGEIPTIIVNIFVLINLVLWFGTYIKKYIISRNSRKYMMELNCNYAILNSIGPEYWVQDILEFYKKIEDNQEKKFLINAIADELKNDCNLYSINVDNNVVHIKIDEKLPDRLQEIIKKSTLSDDEKEKLCKPLKNKTKKSVSVDYGKIRDKRLDKVKKSFHSLKKSGIIYK